MHHLSPASALQPTEMGRVFKIEGFQEAYVQLLVPESEISSRGVGLFIAKLDHASLARLRAPAGLDGRAVGGGVRGHLARLSTYSVGVDTNKTNLPGWEACCCDGKYFGSFSKSQVSLFFHPRCLFDSV